MDDSDRNILSALAHEACEACAHCGEHLCASSHPFNHSGFDFYLDEDREQPVHEECLDEARTAWEDARAEAVMEARWERQEADFNARWPT